MAFAALIVAVLLFLLAAVHVALGPLELGWLGAMFLALGLLAHVGLPSGPWTGR